MFQELISYGHDWLSVQNYSLAEVGSFLSAVLIKKRQDNLTQLLDSWLGANLSQKGLERVIKERFGVKEQLATSEEIEDSWKRLKILSKQVR